MYNRTHHLLNQLLLHIDRIQKEENKELVEIHHLFLTGNKFNFSLWKSN